MISTHEWTYNGEKFDDALAEGYHGFVYLITNIESGRQYIGKKSFWSTRRLKVKGKKRRKVQKNESDWRNYFGSSEELLSDIELLGRSSFTRRILLLCPKRGDCTYHETRLIIENGCLLDQGRWYNKWFSAKVHASHLTPSS